jgi:transposase-like protein
MIGSHQCGRCGSLKHILGLEARAGKRRRGEQQAQTLNLMRAAWKGTTPEEGEKRLEQLARFLERDYESAARSLRERMAEMCTLQRLKLPPSQYKCLATTNLIESPQSGVARRTANVKYWRDQGMVERWVASVWLLTENRFRKISGHRDLWRRPRFSDAKPRLKSRRRSSII